MSALARGSKQLDLKLRTWGGKRKHAGRKPIGARSGVSHRARPKLTEHTPAHVTLRLRSDLPNLRKAPVTGVVRAALIAASARFGFRLVHYSIQTNHLHLLVEANHRAALAKGMKGLSVRLARALNRLCERAGRVFADRYHVRVLRKPREVALALVYVLNNARKHRVLDRWIRLDPCASLARPAGLAQGRSWLLSTGWRRYGPFNPFTVPAVA
jgi:REP element-mobilizing transposase RayT